MLTPQKKAQKHLASAPFRCLTSGHLFPLVPQIALILQKLLGFSHFPLHFSGNPLAFAARFGLRVIGGDSETLFHPALYFPDLSFCLVHRAASHTVSFVD